MTLLLFRVSGKHFNGLKELQALQRPIAFSGIRSSQAESVRAIVEEDQFVLDAVGGEGVGEHLGVLPGDDFVVFALDEEAGGGVVGNAELEGKLLIEAGGEVFPEEAVSGTAVGVGGDHGDDGVDEDGEVRAVGFVVEESGCRASEVAAGGEAHDADVFGVDVERFGLLTDHFDGGLGVVELGGIAIGGDTVAEEVGGDAMTIPPAADVLAFVGVH